MTFLLSLSSMMMIFSLSSLTREYFQSIILEFLALSICLSLTLLAIQLLSQI